MKKLFEKVAATTENVATAITALIILAATVAGEGLLISIGIDAIKGMTTSSVVWRVFVILGLVGLAMVIAVMGLLAMDNLFDFGIFKKKDTETPESDK